jgi:hypothetical protein
MPHAFTTTGPVKEHVCGVHVMPGGQSHAPLQSATDGPADAFVHCAADMQAPVGVLDAPTVTQQKSFPEHGGLHPIPSDSLPASATHAPPSEPASMR